MKWNNLDKKTQKKMIQFSKIIVASVTVAVTILCGFSMWLCYQESAPEGIVKVLGHYMDFAIVAFVSYSVNSISEKAIVNNVFTKRAQREEGDGVG